MRAQILDISISPFFQSGLVASSPGRLKGKKVVCISRAKPRKGDLERVDALENAITNCLADELDPSKPGSSIIFDLSGSAWYLGGVGLNLPQMRELQKRFTEMEEIVEIVERKDKLGKFLKLTPRN